MYTLEDIQAVDMEVAQAITDELDRQNSHIELIASENWVSPAVMSAMGSVLTNKYAEGYPGKRYYGGCEDVDILENLAIERAKELFGCEHVSRRSSRYYFYRGSLYGAREALEIWAEEHGGSGAALA